MTAMADSLGISKISNEGEKPQAKNKTQFCNGNKMKSIPNRHSFWFICMLFFALVFYTLSTYISRYMLHRTLGWAMWLNFSDRNALFKNIVCVLLRCAYTVLYLFMCAYIDNKTYVSARLSVCVSAYWIENTDSCIYFIVATSACCCCDEVTKSEPVKHTESFFLLPLYFINSF